MPAPGGRVPVLGPRQRRRARLLPRALRGRPASTKLLAVADKELTVAERVGVIRDVNALAEAGELPMADALALVPRFANDPNAPDRPGHAAHRLGHQGAPGGAGPLRPTTRGSSRRCTAEARRALGFTPKPGDDDDTKLLRVALLGFVALEGRGARPAGGGPAARRSRGSTTAPPFRRRWSATCSSAPGATAIAPCSTATGGRRRRTRGGATGPPLQRARQLPGSGAARRKPSRSTLDPTLDYRETDRRIFYGHRHARGPRGAVEVRAGELRRHRRADAARDDRANRRTWPRGSATPQQEEVAKFFLSGRVEKLPGGPRNLAQVLEGIDLCIASARPRRSRGLGEFLARY